MAADGRNKGISLFKCFEPVFSCCLELEESLSKDSNDELSITNIQQDLLQKISQAKSLALQSGNSERDIEEATFATVAWVDQILARFLSGNAGVIPLQSALFNTSHAGEEFFDHLAALSADQKEPREVFYTAIALGFVGKYFMDTGDNGELARLLTYHGQLLSVPPVSSKSLPEERLIPQLYQSEDPGPAKVPTNWKRPAMWAAGLLLAVTVCVVALVVIFKPKMVIARDVLQSQLAGFGCSRIQATVDDDNKVTLSGYISERDEVDRLVKNVLSIKGVKDVTTDLHSIAQPYCEVLQAISDHLPGNGTPDPSLQFIPNEANGQFHEGENLLLKLSVPAIKGYFYLDYYQKDGSVVHMLPNPVDRNNLLDGDPGEITIGAPPFKRIYPVSPPFGQEMVVALASPVPLFQLQRQEVEGRKSYLSELSQQLKEQGEKVVADFQFITTESSR
jgi:type IV/VI secretion system ImpK/VasF family protein